MKWITFGERDKMRHIWIKGSNFIKQVTFGEIGQAYKMGHSWKNGSHLIKKWHMEKLKCDPSFLKVRHFAKCDSFYKL